MFSNKDLKRMIVPLFLEQLLVILVGLADTFVISFAGESAVSGVSLVNSFNTIFIFLFTALASGGAVIVSQYIGGKKREMAGESAQCHLDKDDAKNSVCRNMYPVLFLYNFIKHLTG